MGAAVTGRIGTHRCFMRGSYLGTVGAFVGATVVSQRDIPQLAVHDPMLLSAAALAVSALAWAVVSLTRLQWRQATASRPSRPALDDAVPDRGDALP